MRDFVRGQLTFDFPEVAAVGSLDEAMELWSHQDKRRMGNSDGTPPGWEYLGSGGTRIAYKAPSGVCYKVCYEYEADDESHNDVEHKNMRRIAREGKLPEGWRVPNTWLHVFEAKAAKWDYHMRRRRERTERIAILACDYIEGTALNWAAPDAEKQKLEAAFHACGLNDTGGANAIKTEDGTYYVIDAAEWMKPEGEPSSIPDAPESPIDDDF